MTKTMSCPLCQTQCSAESQPCDIDGTGPQPVYWPECPTCGHYIITKGAIDCSYYPNRKEKLYIISGVTRNHYELNKSEFTIIGKMIRDDSEFETKILSQEPKTVLGKVELLLQYIARKSTHPGNNVSVNLSRDYPICFCKNAGELQFYIRHLEEIGDIKGLSPATSGGYSFLLAAEGWRKIESMTRPNLESKQAFVAMWFDESLKEIFTKGIEPLEEDTGFEMYRVDQEPFNEKICDRIIADIRESRFLIADVTGLRNAVFFEAGYAMGLGLPVIFTCKKETEIEGCFDTRQYNHIVWENAEDLKTKLKDRILATIGKVP